MKKYDVMGWEMAKMEDVKWCIRNVRRDIDSFGSHKSEEARDFAKFILELVVRNMFIDEIRAAKSDEEKENILEMTGDFIVAVSEGHGKQMTVKFFKKYDNQVPVFTRHGYEAMKFDYESMATHVAETIGENAHVIDLNEQEHEKNRSIIKAITSFGECEDEES
jgi:hypothetical protein